MILFIYFKWKATYIFDSEYLWFWKFILNFQSEETWIMNMTLQYINRSWLIRKQCTGNTKLFSLISTNIANKESWRRRRDKLSYTEYFLFLSLSNSPRISNSYIPTTGFRIVWYYHSAWPPMGVNLRPDKH